MRYVAAPHTTFLKSHLSCAAIIDGSDHKGFPTYGFTSDFEHSIGANGGFKS